VFRLYAALQFFEEDGNTSYQEADAYPLCTNQARSIIQLYGAL
jgi:hypothetical protein